MAGHRSSDGVGGLLARYRRLVAEMPVHRMGERAFREGVQACLMMMADLMELSHGQEGIGEASEQGEGVQDREARERTGEEVVEEAAGSVRGEMRGSPAPEEGVT